MKNTLLKFLTSLWLVSLSLALSAQEINPGQSFVDGQRLTAAQLTALVSQATIQPAFYTDKVGQTNIGSSDLILVYSPSSGTFHKVTGAQGIYNNPTIISSQITYNNLLNTNYFLLGYDGTNVNLFQFNLTNLLWTAAPLIQVAALNLSNTLANYVGPRMNPYYMTNQLQFLVWDTNGIAAQFSLSNLMLSIQPTMATNLNLPYNWQQFFSPWSLYGTNSTTNAFSVNVLMPITNIFYGPSNLITLSNVDTIPINSSLQFSNTVVTLQALYEYFTNLNALPAYTQARCQFSGIPIELTITNANTTYGSLATSNFGWWATSPAFPSTGVPYAISFITNGTGFYFAGAQSNTVYYIDAFATNSAWFRVYTNYAQALAQTNWVPITSTGSGSQHVLYLTNYAGFNADAIQTSAGQNINQSEYQVCFRSPSPTPFYYIGGMAMSDGNHGGNAVSLNIDPINIVTTNKVQIITVESGAVNYQSPLIHVIVSPQ